MKIKLSTFNMLAMLIMYILSVFTGRLTGELALLGGILVIGYFSVYLKDWELDVECLAKTMKSLATYPIKVK